MVVCLPRARKVQAAPTGPAGCQRDASAVPRPSRAGALAARRRPFLPHGGTGGRGAKVAPCGVPRDRRSFPDQVLARLAESRFAQGALAESQTVSWQLRRHREGGLAGTANAVPAVFLMQDCRRIVTAPRRPGSARRRGGGRGAAEIPCSTRGRRGPGLASARGHRGVPHLWPHRGQE